MYRVVTALIATAFLIIGLSMGSIVFAQTNDAIALRIMPNLEHYDALRWYQKNVDQDQQGSPTQLFVDGYPAVRDGRTVYVAAGNVGGTTLYTNIYILSYTQNPSGETVDIFGQLLNNWTFNINVVQSGAGFCHALKDNAPTTQQCYTDLDCGLNSGNYCASAKAKVTRDVRRLSDLRTITDAAEAYKTGHDDTPVQLLAGSYIRGISLSVWPSWRDTLGQILGIVMPIDPLNSLWACRNNATTDPAGDGTCWNETTKNFNGGDGAIPTVLQSLGRVYSYIFRDDTYRVCADNEAEDSSVYNTIFGNNPACF